MPTKSLTADAKSRNPVAALAWYGVVGARSEPARDPKQSWTSALAAVGTTARHRPSEAAPLPTLHQVVPRAV
jgi:hypothetical protein